MSNFAERLKELRESQGLTLEQFGNMLCLSKSAINMYERGEREPSFKILERIADYCNVDIDFLIRGSHSKQEEVKKVNNPLFYTPEEAETAVKAYGQRGPTAEAIRYQAKEDPRKLGFPVSVIGSRVYIPRHSFNHFFGIGGENECGSLE